MSKREKQAAALSAVLALGLWGAPSASAMHIMEGYLPPSLCAAWGLVCLPVLALGVRSIRRLAGERAMLLLAMAGAFVFVVSSLKIPSATGSCSHMTGTGLAAILFGVPATSVLGVIVLAFQAVLLAHGGLTTLGANVFSMAIAGPLASWCLYRAGRRGRLPGKLNVFLAAALGDLVTYCATSVQLALAYPSEHGGAAASAVEFLAVFAPTQLPLAVVEGLLTMLAVMGMEAYALPELRAIGYTKEV